MLVLVRPSRGDADRRAPLAVLLVLLFRRPRLAAARGGALDAHLAVHAPPPGLLALLTEPPAADAAPTRAPGPPPPPPIAEADSVWCPHRRRIIIPGLG